MGSIAAARTCITSLLEKSIERSWDTKLSHPPPPIRLLDFHAPYRLRFIGPVQQLFPDGEPVLLQVATELADGPPPSIPALPLFLPSPAVMPPTDFFSLTYFPMSRMWC